MTGATPEQNAESGYTITRVFNAPRQLVWDAITRPEQFAVWFGTDKTQVEVQEMDVRPGGAWRVKMVFGDHEMPWSGEYREVVEPERLVLAFINSGQFTGDVFELYTFTLTDLGGKTEFVLRQTGGHLTDEQYEQARVGTAGFLDSMADLLAKKQ
jgi:uncharacterized protein YndB with AHSA1/START domain